MGSRKMHHLIGVWQIDSSDIAAMERYGLVILEFREDRQLIYTIDTGDKLQRIFLTYQIDDGKLITNQPSSPREEVTRYELLGERLILFYGSTGTTFLRKETTNAREL